MRVIVTGSRTWDDIRTIRWTLTWIDTHNPGPHTLVSGACPNGADRLAEVIAGQLGWTVELHPAQWKRPDGSVNKGAGFARNREMALLGGDVCVAFHRDGSRGTAHMINRCVDAGIPVQQYLYTPVVAG